METPRDAGQTDSVEKGLLDGHGAVGRMMSDGEQQEVGVIRSGISPSLTGQKNLLVLSIPGRLTVWIIFHHGRHQRPHEATNASNVEGSTTQSVS